MPGYAELGVGSNSSFLDGASHPAELVATAAELGLAGIGICDTNSLAGVVRGHVAAKKLGLPFAIGTRLELLDGSRVRGRRKRETPLSPGAPSLRRARTIASSASGLEQNHLSPVSDQVPSSRA